MAKNKTCEYCGKEGIDGRHINLCSKNPKNMPVDALPLESVPVTIENVTSKLVEPTTERLKCPDCGEAAVMLNSLDYRCPKCGDRELRRPMPVKGI